VEDIPYLVQHFVEKFARELDRGVQGVAPEVVEHLKGLRYPGNVRELENIMEHAVTFASGPVITMDALPEHVRTAETVQPENDVAAVPAEGIDMEARLADIERRILLNALKVTKGMRKEAANLLGISFRSMRYKLAKYGISAADIEEL